MSGFFKKGKFRNRVIQKQSNLEMQKQLNIEIQKQGNKNKLLTPIWKYIIFKALSYIKN